MKKKGFESAKERGHICVAEVEDFLVELGKSEPSEQTSNYGGNSGGLQESKGSLPGKMERAKWRNAKCVRKQRTATLRRETLAGEPRQGPLY